MRVANPAERVRSSEAVLARVEVDRHELGGMVRVWVPVTVPHPRADERLAAPAARAAGERRLRGLRVEHAMLAHEERVAQRERVSMAQLWDEFGRSLEPARSRAGKQVQDGVHLPANHAVADEERVATGEEPACTSRAEPRAAALRPTIHEPSSGPVGVARMQQATRTDRVPPRWHRR